MNEFDAIIGYKDIKDELKKLCDVMRNEGNYKKLGVKVPSGLLLYGDPGVGKTLMANCLIKASGRRAFVCRKDKPDGDFVNEITRVFDEAMKNAPSIVFLDDMDKFSNEDYYHRNSEEYVTVQSCIDAVKNRGVFVLATANEVRGLPDSLLRAGRFDKAFEVCSPWGSDAVEIVDYYLKQKKFVGDIDAKEIARILNGRSCAELETVINEAGLIAGYAGKQVIEMDDMIKACMRVIFDAPESREQYPAEDVERIAYHEAGHAVIGELLEPESVTLISVCRHDSDTYGVTAYYNNDSYFMYKKYMENRVMVLLGGKAATEVKYGETDVGCTNDVRRAFDIVERFVDDYCSSSFDRWQSGPSSSPALTERKEMQKAFEVEQFYAKARKMLVQNREFLDKLAAALIEKKTLIARDIEAIKNTCKLAA